MTRPDRTRHEHQPSFVLHTYAFRETSMVVEVFTRDFGRVALMARGARRPKSALRGLLQSFQPLLLSWIGGGELRTLTQAEWMGGQPLLKGQGLLCGFYLSELILKLLQRDDPHEGLFHAYRLALQGFAHSGDYNGELRKFEKSLLRELGYALSLERDAETGSAILADTEYAYVLERGPVGRTVRENAVQLRGKTLLDMARDDYSDPHTANQAKLLMRFLIGHYLGHQELNTRQVFKDLQQL
jgi:DNA repair protein RecO (recombination protein O)